MKKTTLFVAIFLLFATLNAQNPALNVPKFKGIEITGTVDQFGTKLSSQGFTFIGKESYGSAYMGRFAGKDDCFIVLAPVENSNDIASVNVMIGLKFSEYEVYSYETWEKLLSDYNDLKDLLTEKYGEPTENTEGFTKDAYTHSSYSKLNSVKNGQCEYSAKWGDKDVDKMVVRLSITGGKNMGLECAIITLQYWNVEKTNSSKKEIIDDL
ncbi:MAG: hypothetical protein IKN98_01155 [Bacteroidales bacterium]|nr:hypothetical protein [Bacteroidales bacterium]